MECRTAFVTGASSGIGRALCLRLAREGVEVCLAARRRDLLDTLASEISGAGGTARVYVLDVTAPENAQATIRQADDDVGGLDLIVANAGVGRERWSGKLQWAEDCESIVAVNVTGAVVTLTAVLPRMVERRRGHLVGISSLGGLRALPRNATYCASKAFLSTFLEGIRMDLRGTGVSITDVRPGFVRTPMTARNEHPMPLMVDAPDAADAIFAGIRDRATEVAFPWPLATLARSARFLPNAVYERAVLRARG